MAVVCMPGGQQAVYLVVEEQDVAGIWRGGGGGLFPTKWNG